MCCYWQIWKRTRIFLLMLRVFFKSNRSVWNSEKPNRKQIGNLAGKKMPSKTWNMRSFCIAQHFHVVVPSWRDDVPMATIFWLTLFLKFWRGPEAGQLQGAWVPDWTFFRGVGPGPSPWSTNVNPSDITPPPPPPTSSLYWNESIQNVFWPALLCSLFWNAFLVRL